MNLTLSGELNCELLDDGSEPRPYYNTLIDSIASIAYPYVLLDIAQFEGLSEVNICNRYHV